MKNVTKIQGISLFSLVMLITAAIDSIRNMPTTALFGSQMIFFFVVSAIVFLVPVGLVSAQLSSNWTDESGIYSWVKRAFGSKIAFIAIWLQWINTMVWYPTILSFIAGTISYLIDPQLAQNKLYLVSIIMGTFWLLTILNLKGVQTSAKFASVCGIIGMVIPVALIITLGAIWVVSGKPLHIDLSAPNLIPHFGHSQSWISLTAIMTAFLGMELATVHVKDVNQPRKTFPKALAISIVIILFTMILGSLSIGFILPKSHIQLVDGVMQAFSAFFHVYHLGWLIPIVTVMIVIGSLGGMINWIISPAKGLLQAAQDGHLPKFLCKQNKNGVAANLLIIQALLVSAVCSAFLLMPSVNGSYWLLTDLSTQLYMFMYVVMFIAAAYLAYKFSMKDASFTIPGGKKGMWAVCLLGLSGCMITIAVGFIPPSNIKVGGALHYEVIFCIGIIAMLIPGLLLLLKKKQTITANA